MLLRAIIPGALLCMATYAHADDQQLRDVSIGDLKAKCKELMADPQIKPVKVKISCDDTTRFWQQGKGGKGKLKHGRRGGYQAQMKGFQVPRQTFDVPQQDTEIACARYVEFERVVKSVDAELSCQDLLAIEDFNGYCSTLVDQRVQADPELVEIRETGAVEYNCPNETP